MNQLNYSRFVVIIIVASLSSDAFSFGQTKLPCEFLDSVNITDGIRNANGTIIYDGVSFPPDQYAKVDYILTNGLKREFAKEHIRGCICAIKSCIRLCCPHGQIVDVSITDGRKCRPHEQMSNFKDLVEEKYFEEKRPVEEYFGFVDDRPCKNLYEMEEFLIKNTGHVTHSNYTIPHSEYCVKSSYNESANELALSLLICYEVDGTEEARYTILSSGMLLSVPFIVATFLVYICLPELCNLHGKCLLGYLIGLAIGYTAMALVQLNGSNYVEPLPCKSIGYLIYFSFLSAFLWLSVISFDLWLNFRTMSGSQMFSERKRFVLYMIYAWGLSLALTVIAFLLDSSESIPENLQPGIGVNTCFLKKNSFTQALFFYSPLSIIFTVNFVFFVLTALKIRQVQRDLNKITSQEESSRHQSNLNNDKDNFTLFLRLFIVMGITWSMEVISFFISENSMFFIVTDVCNTVQGVLIFILFVLKRRVLRLIKRRWQIFFGKAISNGSSATNSTSTTFRSSNLRLNHITTSNDPKREAR